MSLKLGNTNIGELYVGSNKITQAYLGSNLVYQSAAPGPVLPANTVRVITNDGRVPYKDAGASYETATLVPGTSNVYDVYKSDTSFRRLLYGSDNVIEVLGANTSNITTMEQMFFNCGQLTTAPLFNTSNVTNMNQMFNYCTSLTSVPLFNTSNVTNMERMFGDCSSLTNVPLFDTSKVTMTRYMFNRCTALQSVPLFDTSKVTNMGWMFAGCVNVQSGALALYQQASTQTTPPSKHTQTFNNCGRDTETGAAELAQIPSGWK